MSTVEHTRIELHANQEHAGVRVTVVVVLLAVFVVVFALVNTVLNGVPKGGIGEFALPISCITGLVVGLGIAGITEQVLKRRWHSGQSLILGHAGIEARLPDEETTYLDWAKRLGAIKWYFSLKGYPRGGRERRLHSSWFCLGCQLQQDEHRLVVFGYLPPSEAKRLLEDGAFHEIRPGDLYDLGPVRRRFAPTDRPKLPANLLTGKDGPYWLAERRRWSAGLELTPADFTTFIETIDEHLED